MAGVYSTRFFALQGATTGTYTYTVPAGYVAIMRDADVYNNDTFGPSLFIQNAAGGAIFPVKITGEGSGYFSWRGRQVFEALEEINVVIDEGTWDVTVSGYLLTDESA